jgi:hypothetical protein
MKSVKNGPIYRPMLWRALQTAWNHKELWPFALFAGLAGSGVIVNDLMQQAQIALAPSDDVLNMLGGELGSFVQRYFQLVITSGGSHILYTILGTLIILCAGGFLIVLCQQLLLVALHRAVHKKTRLTGRDLLRTLHHHHFLRILGVDLFFHVLIFMVLGGGGTLMRNLPITIPAAGAVAVLLAAGTLFIAFVLNIIAMLTLIAVGEENVTIITGVLEAIDRFLRHPLVACETALMVFGANLILTVVYIFGLAVLGIPVGILFAEALANSALLPMVFVTLFGTIAAVMFTILSAGFMTTFTYSIWTLLAEQLDRMPFGSRFHHHIRRHLTR